MNVKIGTIINTHGLKGEMKVVSSSDYEDIRYQAGSLVFVNYHKQEIPFEVETVRVHKGCFLITFKGYANINDIEKYKGCELMAEAIEDDQYYYYELIGCKVRVDGKIIGEVSEMIETEAHEILRIKRENQKDALIPYVDAFILNEDMENKVIDVQVIEGLL